MHLSTTNYILNRRYSEKVIRMKYGLEESLREVRELQDRPSECRRLPLAN